MRLSHRQQDHALIVTIEGSFGISEVGAIQETLKSLTQESSSTVLILDLKKVEFFDSSGMGTILFLYKYLRQQNKELKLCHLNDYLFDAFKLAKLHTFFTFYPSIEAALE